MSDLLTDVLVVGGGPAATWAALKAAEDGARVVLADKGWCGTSGATAAGGTGVWYVPPEPAAREAAMASREGLGGYLADRRWMARVLDETYDRINELAVEGRYPFPTGTDGQPLRGGLQGPEYMRRMRVRVRRAGVRILDHSPVTELLTDRDGAVAGAAGHRRQAGELGRAGRRPARAVPRLGQRRHLAGRRGRRGGAPPDGERRRAPRPPRGGGTRTGEVLPYDKNYLRHGEGLSEALRSLDAGWAQLRARLHGEGAGLVKARQAAAMTAHARWMYASALARTESRGMARRLDHPEQDPAQHHRILAGGLDRVWAGPAAGRGTGVAV
ncbi:FAD-binding protein [Streptomyces sp. DK15]|uniref:FAD-binding protein n=1 Tax=Streptomyces sp. DK15 TaxID=2957499 RepID=UPI0029BC1815|nr:FAD-binding protein [Streptomyces sp. DK15]MDX2395160.1 FAD-binding protein [Streptomyces sp. DK15]